MRCAVPPVVSSSILFASHRLAHPALTLDLIARAAQNSQILAVSHAPKLIAALTEQPDCHSIVLEKEFGETSIAGAGSMDRPSWHWPAR
jgi:predicted ATPase